MHDKFCMFWNTLVYTFSHLIANYFRGVENCLFFGFYYVHDKQPSYRKLNLPRKPCNDDPTYNYRSCIKESLSKMIGCRMPWDKDSDQARSICSTMEQYRWSERTRHFMFNFIPGILRTITIGLTFLRLKKLPNKLIAWRPALTRNTGHTKQTKYQEHLCQWLHRFIGERTATAFHSDHFVVSLWAVSNDTSVESEVLIFPLLSLVAEFGGTLSLFIGFSFFTLWDVLEHPLQGIYQKLK